MPWPGRAGGANAPGVHYLGITRMQNGIGVNDEPP